MKENHGKPLLLWILLSSASTSVAFSSTCSLYLHPLTSLTAKRSNDDDGKEDSSSLPRDRKRLEDSQEEISKKQSQSRNKAISALSQPKDNEVDPKRRAMSKLARPPASEKSSRQSNPASSGSKDKRETTLLPRAAVGFKKTKGRGSGSRPAKWKVIPPAETPPAGDQSFFSLLPPPIMDSKYQKRNDKEESLSGGLSSWVDFLGPGTSSSGSSQSPSRRKNQDLGGQGASSQTAGSSPRDGLRDRQRNVNNNDRVTKDDRLPSISDLFPPDFSNSSSKQQRRSINYSDGKSTGKNPTPPPSLDGVLPVSDLFYRSSQSMNEDEDLTRDDEELPFSAEQSDRLTTGNRIRVRRNQASSSSVRSSKGDTRKKSMGTLKMVRRGMEMLVGGVPINADPPQRYIDLVYAHQEAEKGNWHSAITMNTRDFGPLLHTSSVRKVSRVEQGLFCEHFVHYTNKWDVCPKDLRTIVKAFSFADDVPEVPSDVDDIYTSALGLGDILPENDDSEPSRTTEYSSLGVRRAAGVATESDELPDLDANPGGEIVFRIGVSREELQSADSPSEVPVLERVLAKGIAASTDCSGFSVVFTRLILTDLEDGTTQIIGNFQLNLKDDQSMSYGEMQSKSHRISSSLAQATDEGSMQLAMAAAARDETSWPEALRNRIVEEFLFDDDEDDFRWENKKIDSPNDVNGQDQLVAEVGGLRLDYLTSERGSPLEEDGTDGPFGMPGSVEYHEDDIFLGNGNDGVFWNYAEQKADQSPFGGALGLRLVDSVIERAKQRQPRVIAIGDVHGCIDELQELLRRCDYRPGDLLVFLGDLVSKGPDSIAVVQMAREIGAFGVRGNHDFEVIRWHQAIKSGIDPPVVGSEHFQIASCLTKADMKWMYR